jgi:hypothetical protein
MATEKQKRSAKKNIKKAQEARQNILPGKRAEDQLGGREKPGATGEGEFYHIEVRPKEQFKTFRTHDVGKKGGIERVAGQRENGSWDDQKWLVSKELAHVENSKLIPDTQDAREVLNALGSQPVHLEGDRFKAKPRGDVPETEKPTPAQRKAQQENIKKAQAARR